MQGPLEHGVNHPEEGVRWTSPRRHRPDVGGLAAHREDEPQQQHELFIGERHSVLLQRNVVVGEGDVLLGARVRSRRRGIGGVGWLKRRVTPLSCWGKRIRHLLQNRHSGDV